MHCCNQRISEAPAGYDSQTRPHFIFAVHAPAAYTMSIDGLKAHGNFPPPPERQATHAHRRGLCLQPIGRGERPRSSRLLLSHDVVFRNPGGVSQEYLERAQSQQFLLTRSWPHRRQMLGTYYHFWQDLTAQYGPYAIGVMLGKLNDWFLDETRESERKAPASVCVRRGIARMPHGVTRHPITR